MGLGPTVKAPGRVNLPAPGGESIYDQRTPMSSPPPVPSLSSSRKKVVIILRWLLIVSAWALYSSRSDTRMLLHGHVVFVVSALSNLGLMALPGRFFSRTRFTFIVLVADTLLASILVYGQGAGDYTLFLIFFLMILFSAVGQKFTTVMSAGLLVAMVYCLVTIHYTSLQTFLTHSDMLLKIPFLLVISLFYGHFVEENQRLNEMVVRYTEQVEHYGAEIQKTYWETLKSLVGALDLRDTSTRHHSMRVGAYTLELCRVLGIPQSQWVDIERGALLHDVGKIGISDTILLKPSSLTDEEWKIMKTHPVLGYQMVQGIPFLERAADIILYHHERFDGKGYPFGLRGEAIPLAARVFAVADTIDAITSGRPYKQQQDIQQVERALLRNAGTQFDPQVVKAFFQIQREHWAELRRQCEAEIPPPAPLPAPPAEAQAPAPAPPAGGPAVQA